MRPKTRICVLIACCLTTWCCGIGCDRNSDDSDDDDNDHSIADEDNGWSADSCQYEKEEQADADGDGCIPELPDPELLDPLEAMLTAYLGDYEDQDGGIVKVACDPNGAWALPHFFTGDNAPPCDYWYALPILVRIGQNEAVSGVIENGAGASIESDPLAIWAELAFKFDGVYSRGTRGPIGGELVWNFGGGDVWVKK